MRKGHGEEGTERAGLEQRRLPERWPASARHVSLSSGCDLCALACCRALFHSAAEAHVRAVVGQLLMVEGVPRPDVWGPVLSGAAAAVASYLSPPQMYVAGQHDPRMSLKVRGCAFVGGGGRAGAWHACKGVSLEAMLRVRVGVNGHCA